MNDRDARQAIARAEAKFQLARPFARGLVVELTPSQRQTVEALLFNAGLYAIDAWEKGRPARDAAAFYEGRS